MKNGTNFLKIQNFFGRLEAEEVYKAGLNTKINNMIRAKITENVGASKYVVSYSNGNKKHPDGSDFFDIKIFKSKLKAYEFYNSLLD